MSSTVLTKPCDIEQKVVRLIQNEEIPNNAKSVQINHSQIQQLFDCSKEELVLALKHKRECKM